MAMWDSRWGENAAEEEEREEERCDGIVDDGESKKEKLRHYLWCQYHTW